MYKRNKKLIKKTVQSMVVLWLSVACVNQNQVAQQSSSKLASSPQSSGGGNAPIIVLDDGDYGIKNGYNNIRSPVFNFQKIPGTNLKYELQVSDGVFSHKVEVTQTSNVLDINSKYCIPVPCAPPSNQNPNPVCPQSCKDVKYQIEIRDVDEFEIKNSSTFNGLYQHM